MKHADEYKKPSLESTAHFVELVDNMFDCLNVGNYTDGKLARKCFKQPYRACSDFRLKVQHNVHLHIIYILAVLHTEVCIYM